VRPKIQAKEEKQVTKYFKPVFGKTLIAES
jgi:hypothetical protein